MKANKTPQRAGWGNSTAGAGAQTRGNYTPIRAGNGAVIGEVVGDTFVKRLKNSGFLRSPAGIAFELQTLDQAERAGARKVEVTNVETNTVYRASLDRIRRKGFKRFAGQWALALADWSVAKPGEPEQLSLFGGGGQ